MIGKLDGSHSSAELTGNLESKLINLQSQLTDLKEQREKGTLSNQVQQESQSLSSSSYGGFNNRGRGLVRGGPSRGRLAPRGRGVFRGGKERYQWVASSNPGPSTSILSDSHIEMSGEINLIGKNEADAKAVESN